MSMRMTLLLLLITMMILLATSYPRSRRRWRRSRRKSSSSSSPSKHTKITKTTKYGDSNVCEVCTTHSFKCNATEYVPCTNRNSSSKANTKEGKEKRGKRHASDEPHEHKWNEWNDNDHKEGPTSMPLIPIGPSLKKCKKTYTKTCSEEKCEIKCCDGTRRETGTNSCKNRRNFDGTLNGCLNGGTLNSRKTHCTCPDDFIGVQCQHRKCAKTCQNGGQCQTNTTHTGGRVGDTTYNDDYCICPSGTSGDFCENKKCEKECKNNGTCVLRSSWWTMCACPPGYKGSYCERKEKEGECPSRGDLGNNCGGFYMHRRYDCHHDEDCEGSKKCCRNACFENVCTDPTDVNVTCTYNNNTHPLGSVFFPDPCRVCTCNDSHDGLFHGAIQCTRLMCPDLSPDCKNNSIPPDACCPMCHDHSTINMCGNNYRYPYFVNCPDEEVILDLEEGSNTAKVNMTLVAKDCEGNELKVRLSDNRFQAGVGEENYHLLSASSERDGRGNFAECIFHVRIRDTQPPKFVTCPMDFVESSEMPASWPLPVAQDNVGLKMPPTSVRHPGQMLPPGKFMIDYWVEDYEGNMARCSFLVTIVDYKASRQNKRNDHSHHNDHDYDYDHNPHHDPHYGHDSPHVQHRQDGLKIGIGFAALLFVGLLGVLVFVFYRRYRRTQEVAQGGGRAAAGSSVRMSTVNGAGSGAGWSGNNLPGYGLPPDDIMSPPVYSRMDDMMASGGAPEAAELPAKRPLPQ